ncbi:hypothetical protein Tco_1295574 [Tanacetum coccineum]
MDSPPNHEWEQAPDIDDSDLRLNSIVRPNNNPHILPETTTTTQTLFSFQNHQVDNCIIKPIGIIPGPAGIVQTAKLRKIVDTKEAWLSMSMLIEGSRLAILEMSRKFFKNGKLEKVVAIIKSCTPNALGDLTVTLKDLSNTISGTIHYKVHTEERFAKAITVGASLILHNVFVFSLKQSNHHYLNITKKNKVKVFHKDDGSS